MDEDSPDSAPPGLWLSRSEAARYVGVSGESAIRAAEDKGLAAVADVDGQFWHKPAALDVWKWRGKTPSDAQKARVLREAQRARRQEARERERKEEAEAQQEQAEWEAQLKRGEAEEALRASVRQKAKERRAAFEFAHMDERTAGRALGFEGYEGRAKLRVLVNRGLLRRVESPTEPRVEVSFEGVREAESPWPLCSGGPFYLREEVLSMRRELAELASNELRRAPPHVQGAVRVASSADIVAELLRAFLENFPQGR